MIRYLIILTYVLPLLAARLSFAGDVTVKISASAQAIKGKVFLVSITVKKSSFSGIGELKMPLPAGFLDSAIEMETRGADFNYNPEKNVVRFTWFGLPADEEFTVSYTVRVNPSCSIATITLGGEFFYVLGNQKQSYIIPYFYIAVKDEAVPVAAAPPPKSIPAITSKPEAPAKPPLDAGIVKKDAGIKNKDAVVVKPPAVVSSAQDAVVYQVQLGASNKEIPSSEFTNAGLTIEMKKDDGLYKYVAGRFNSFREAMKERNALEKKGFKGAFVVAYQGNKRVPLNAGSSAMSPPKNENPPPKKENLMAKNEILPPKKENPAAKNVIPPTKKNTSEPQKKTQDLTDKSLVFFRVELGTFLKEPSADILQKYIKLPGFEMKKKSSGATQYVTGRFVNYDQAKKFRDEVAQKYGIPDALVIAYYKDELISVHEAVELLK